MTTPSRDSQSRAMCPPVSVERTDLCGNQQSANASYATSEPRGRRQTIRCHSRACLPAVYLTASKLTWVAARYVETGPRSSVTSVTLKRRNNGLTRFLLLADAARRRDRYDRYELTIFRYRQTFPTSFVPFRSPKAPPNGFSGWILRSLIQGAFNRCALPLRSWLGCRGGAAHTGTASRARDPGGSVAAASPEKQSARPRRITGARIRGSSCSTRPPRSLSEKGSDPLRA
jgi:hypothetical protein